MTETMAAQPPINDPLANAAAEAAAGAAAGPEGGACGVPLVGVPPPPLVVSPPASPSPIALAIWAKKPEAERAAFSAAEMRNYRTAQEGNYADPGEPVFLVTTGATEPKCFLTARANSDTATPKIELIHSIGTHVVALGQEDDLHGQTFAFVGDPRRLGRIRVGRRDRAIRSNDHRALCSDQCASIPAKRCSRGGHGLDGSMHDPPHVGTMLPLGWHPEGDVGQDRAAGGGSGGGGPAMVQVHQGMGARSLRRSRQCRRGGEPVNDFCGMERLPWGGGGRA
jgi:hypothetical protein